MKTAAVTGATGCVGRNLVEELLKDGWKVTVLHRASSNTYRLASCDVELKSVDLYDIESVRDSIYENMDVIFHVAGNTSHWRKDALVQWKDNVLSTRNLVHVALEKKVKRFLFTSTGATLGYQGGDEKYANAIKNGYVRTKRLGELEVYKAIEKGLDAIVLHPIIVVGKYDYNSYSQVFMGIKKGEMKKSFPGRIAFCHARDVARAHISAFEKGRCAENYVLGGSYTSWQHFFQKVAKSYGVKSPMKPFSKPMLLVVAYVMNAISLFTKKRPLITPDLVFLLNDAPDVSLQEKRKAKEVLDYESASLDQMIRDCNDWLVEEGML